MRRIGTLLAILLTAGAAAVPAPALAQGGTSAVATNTHDGSDVFRLAFQIRRVMGDTVDQQNAAVAYASCDSCQTTAIAIQVLLIGGDPSTFTPENIALAYNENCTFCDTLASAYQFAVGGSGAPLRFTAEGNQRIAEIRRQLEQLRNSGLSGPDTQAQVDTLMGRLSDVLQNDLVGAGAPSGVENAHGPSSSAPQAGTDTTPTSGTTPSTDTTPGTDTTSGTDTTPSTSTTPTDTTPTQTTPMGTDTTATSPAP